MLKFWSNISLFVQIAIVIAAVLVFAFFDPFGFLTPRKQTLEDTPVSVRSIKEIGKLISSEYYGEVLTSLQEALIDEISAEVSNDSTELAYIQDQFNKAILDLDERKVDFRKTNRFNEAKKLYDFFYKEYPALTQHPYYQTYINLVLDKDKKLNKRKTKRGEKKLYKALYKLTGENLTKALQDLEIDDTTFENERKKKQDLLTADKKFRKKQIVVLGRGWVKAGIDFGQFSERNFRYDQDRRTIHLIGLKPEILISTINPWFIPEKKIKGFEFILITNKANDPKYMQAVKQESLNKLRQKAIQAGVLEQAKINAEENLRSLFSLLIPEGIDQVIIHDNFFSYFDESFVSDSLTYPVMQSVDSLFTKRFKIDSAAVVGLRDSVSERRLYFRGKVFPVNRYSSQLRIAEDETLSEGEKKWLIKEKEAIEIALNFLKDTTSEISRLEALPNRLDSVWFLPKTSIAEKYKSEAESVYHKKFGFFEEISDHPGYIAQLEKRRIYQTRKTYQYIFQQKRAAYQEFTGILKKNLLQVATNTTTYVLNTDTTSTPENIIDPLTKQSIEYLKTLDQQLESIDAGIHDWLKNPREFISPTQLEEINRLMEEDWEMHQAPVIELRNLASSQWEIQVGNQSWPVTRYSSWFGAVKNDTLDSPNLNEIYKTFTAIKSDSALLAKSLKSLDENWKKGLLISDLDRAWYYPIKDSILTYQAEAKKRDFGTWKVQKKKRRMLRESYVDQKICQSIQASRKKDFDEVVSDMLKSVEIVDNKGFKFDVTENGFNPTLPDSLLFLDAFKKR